MQPIRFDLTGREAIYQGTRWSKIFTILDDNGGPLSVSGATAKMQIRTDTFVRGGTQLVEVTAAGGGIALGTPAGSVKPTLTITQTRDLPVGRHKWELDVVLTSGETVTLFGNCDVVGEVAR